MKVKTISNSKLKSFDNDINIFCQHRHIVDIKFSVNLTSSVFYSALIMYEDL